MASTGTPARLPAVAVVAPTEPVDDAVEDDLDRQLLHLVEGGQRTVTLQVSSADGETYTNAKGQARARSPVGDFVVERRIHGLREAALGTP